MVWTQPATRLPGTALDEGQLLPDVTLQEADSGRPWRPGQLRQHAALVLAFVHADCEPCTRFLETLAERDGDLRWAETQARAVAPEPAEAPLPLLVDADGRARERMLGADGEVPTVLVADRYSAAAASYPAAGHAFPDPDEVVATVRHLAILCPECSV